MIEERFNRIQKRVSDSSLDENEKNKLKKLLEQLKSEVDNLTAEHEEDAQRIARYAELTAEEAVKKKPRRDHTDTAVDGLRKSVKDFEESYPKLTQVINTIAQSLANIGI